MPSIFGQNRKNQFFYSYAQVYQFQEAHSLYHIYVVCIIIQLHYIQKSKELASGARWNIFHSIIMIVDNNAHNAQMQTNKMK